MMVDCYPALLHKSLGIRVVHSGQMWWVGGGVVVVVGILEEGPLRLVYSRSCKHRKEKILTVNN